MSNLKTINGAVVTNQEIVGFTADDLVYIPSINQIWILMYGFPNVITKLSAVDGSFIGHVTNPSELWAPIKQMSGRQDYNPSHVITTGSQGFNYFDTDGVKLAEFGLYSEIYQTPYGSRHDYDDRPSFVYDTLGGTDVGSLDGAILQVFLESGNANYYGSGGGSGTTKYLGVTYSYTMTLSGSPVNVVAGHVVNIPVDGPAPLKIVTSEWGDLWFLRNSAAGYELVNVVNIDRVVLLGSVVYTITSSTPPGLPQGIFNKHFLDDGEVLVRATFPNSSNLSHFIHDHDRYCLWLAFAPTVVGQLGTIVEFGLWTNSVWNTYPADTSAWVTPNYPMAYDKFRKVVWVASDTTGYLTGYRTKDGSIFYRIYLDNYRLVKLVITDDSVWAMDGGSGTVYRVLIPAEAPEVIPTKDVYAGVVTTSGSLTGKNVNIYNGWTSASDKPWLEALSTTEVVLKIPQSKIGGRNIPFTGKAKLSLAVDGVKTGRIINITVDETPPVSIHVPVSTSSIKVDNSFGIAWYDVEFLEPGNLLVTTEGSRFVDTKLALYNELGELIVAEDDTAGYYEDVYIWEIGQWSWEIIRINSLPAGKYYIAVGCTDANWSSYPVYNPTRFDAVPNSNFTGPPILETGGIMLNITILPEAQPLPIINPRVDSVTSSYPVVEGAPLVFIVTLNKATEQPVSYEYNVQGITATEGTDFSIVPTCSNGVVAGDASHLIVPAGVTTFTVSFSTYADAITEATEEYVSFVIDGEGSWSTITDQ